VGLKGRLRALERETGRDTMVCVLQDTGEEIRVPFDAPVRWLVAEWKRQTGQPVEPGPVVEDLEVLMRRDLREKHPERDGRILSGPDDTGRAWGWGLGRG
jgi:hypothetical protein